MRGVFASSRYRSWMARHPCRGIILTLRCAGCSGWPAECDALSGAGAVPAGVGILASGGGTVCLRVAGVSKFRSRLADGHQDWILVYAVAMLVGAAVFGTTWFARADPFEVYSVTVSRLAPFRRNRATGRIVLGNPLDHLPNMPVRPGTVAAMAVLLGSTAFDGFSPVRHLQQLRRTQFRGCPEFRGTSVAVR